MGGREVGWEGGREGGREGNEGGGKKGEGREEEGGKREERVEFSERHPDHTTCTADTSYASSINIGLEW